MYRVASSTSLGIKGSDKPAIQRVILLNHRQTDRQTKSTSSFCPLFPSLMSVSKMTRFSSLLCALAFGQSALAAPHLFDRAASALDSWLATETTTALNGILDNIGSSGAYAASAKSGVVIASPSTSSPDCKSIYLYSCCCCLGVHSA